MDGHMLQEPAPKKLTPPISTANPIKTSHSISHPAITFNGDIYLRPNRNPSTYPGRELNTPKLNSIHRHIWLAGRPNAARPLHRQKLLGREILITEDPDEHLVWFEYKVYIKPLPECLLDWNYWNDSICSDLELRKSACGFLLSYAWLVRHKSDLNIAKECGLLPKAIEFSDWVEFLDVFLDNIDLHTLKDVNKRYKYGELRLSRLNAIWRFAPPVYSLHNFVFGYKSGGTWYRAFLHHNFGWMLVVFAFITVLLGAFQVGLATKKLRDNEAFQNASYGITVFSLVAVGASLFLVFLVWLALVCYHLLSTWQNDRVVDRRRSTDVSSP